MAMNQTYAMPTHYMMPYHMVSPFGGSQYTDYINPIKIEDEDIKPNQDPLTRKRKSTTVLKKKSCPKKRKLEIDLNPDTNSCKIVFDRDELLQISSDDFDNYIEKLEKTKTFSKGDKKEIVRQRRLIKNRESAKESRKRKKSHVSELEDKVNILSDINGKLQSSFNAVSQENMHLKIELDRIKNLMNNSGLIGQLQNGVSQIKRQYDDNSVGSLMFVILLSFGLFFTLGIKENSPFSLTEPSGSFKSYSERIFTKDDNFKQTGFTGDLLIDNPRIKEVFEKSTKITAEIVTPKPEVERMIFGSKNANYSFEDVEEKFLDSPSSTKSSFEKIEETSEDEDVVMSEETKGLENVLMANIQFEPNTTYLLCERVKYLTPSSGETEFNPDAPLKLSLFISSTDTADKLEDILEVSCQIRDMNQLSIRRPTTDRKQH